MKIHHIALWTQQLEKMKCFYIDFFSAKASALYVNPKKNFSSYFLTFASGARLELMHRPEVVNASQEGTLSSGYAHIAISLGSKEAVDAKTQELVLAGYTNPEGPRTTGDGFYESIILDPDANIIELTI